MSDSAAYAYRRSIVQGWMIRRPRDLDPGACLRGVLHRVSSVEPGGVWIAGEFFRWFDVPRSWELVSDPVEFWRSFAMNTMLSLTINGVSNSRGYLGPFPRGTRISRVTMSQGAQTTASGLLSNIVQDVSFAAFLGVPLVDSDAAFASGVSLVGSTPHRNGSIPVMKLSGVEHEFPVNLSLRDNTVIGFFLGGTAGHAAVTGNVTFSLQLDEPCEV